MDEDKLRVDKWLWAARFYKTRSLATAAVEGGHVHLNGQRVKPAKDVKPGDTLDITIAEMRWSVMVKALSERRGPAPQAQALYEETAESRTRREAQIEERRAKREAGLHPLPGRPTKRDRRQIERFRRG